jgi:hypothetical protein
VPHTKLVSPNGHARRSASVRGRSGILRKPTTSSLPKLPWGELSSIHSFRSLLASVIEADRPHNGVPVAASRRHAIGEFAIAELMTDAVWEDPTLKEMALLTALLYNAPAATISRRDVSFRSDGAP